MGYGFKDVAWCFIFAAMTEESGWFAPFLPRARLVTVDGGPHVMLRLSWFDVLVLWLIVVGHVSNFSREAFDVRHVAALRSGEVTILDGCVP